MSLFHRFLCSAATALSLAGATAASAEPAAPLTFIGAGQLPTGAMFQGTEIGGLSELLAIGPNRYIALVRAYSAGVGNDIRLFVTDSANATDVRGLDTLKKRQVPCDA